MDPKRVIKPYPIRRFKASLDVSGGDGDLSFKPTLSHYGILKSQLFATAELTVMDRLICDPGDPPQLRGMPVKFYRSQKNTVAMPTKGLA